MRVRAVCGLLAIALAAGSPAQGADAKEQEEDAAFRALIERFEREKEKPPHERLATIGAFARFKTDRCIAFLRGLYASESNAGVQNAVTRALGGIGNEAAVRAIVETGLPQMAEQAFLLDAAVEVLRNVRNSAALYWLAGNALATQAARSNKKVLLALLEVVGGIRLEQSARSITVLLRSRDPEVVAAALIQVRRLRIETAGRAVAQLARSRDPTIQVQALMTLEDLGATTHRSLFVAALRSRAWQVRCIAVDILGKAKDAKLVRTLARALHDPEWRVRAAAVRAVGLAATRDSVTALIERLKLETHNRLKDDIADTLTRLTGKDLGISGLDWESWWRTHGKTVEVRRRSAEEMSRIKEEQADRRTGVYYGLRVVSDNVCFVLDRSGSMAEPYVVKASSLVDRRTGSTEVAGGKKGGTTRKATKLEVAKAELRKVLRALRAGVRFNVIQFSSMYRTWRGALTPKDNASLQAALGFVEALRPAGMTNIQDTLVTAMNDRDVDTIYFLSDGAPTAGSIQDPKEIRRRIRELNRLRRIRIHTIGFHLKPHEEEFLRGLADENDGIFVSR